MKLLIMKNLLVEAMNRCQELSDEDEYKRCLTDYGVNSSITRDLTFQWKDVDPIDYKSIIIQAAKTFIYSQAFQHRR